MSESEETVQACFDRVLPPEFQAIAREQAQREHAANRPSPFEMAIVTSKLWRPGRTLRVRFLDGDPGVQKKVAQVAQQWSKLAHITFAFGNDPDAEIRISFQQRGSWSAIGTDALVKEFFRPNQPTMNYGWLRPGSSDEEYSRVVLHEFGHALGCIHEHQNPAGGIHWNKEAVYRALGGPPNNWPRATVDHNMFETYNRSLTQFTAVDPRSIMMYPIPKEWTTDGFEVGLNKGLSETDKTFIAARYPGATG